MKLQPVHQEVRSRWHRGAYGRFGKRLFDLALTVPALLLLSPVMAVVALLVRFKLGSPVLFRHQRPGIGGRPFILLKFRTMTNARDANGELLPDEERITRLGQNLRHTSVDELPELINVLAGEMSLVGGRNPNRRNDANVRNARADFLSCHGLSFEWRPGTAAFLKRTAGIIQARLRRVTLFYIQESRGHRVRPLLQSSAPPVAKVPRPQKLDAKVSQVPEDC